MTDSVMTMFPSASPEMLLAAAQTVGLVAYARQHMHRINGPWVFPMCVCAAFLVCFASTATVDMHLMQKSVAVSMLAFGAMVLRRGGNAAVKGENPNDDGPPSTRPPPRPSSGHDPSPVTNMMMHAIPFVLIGILCVPIIIKLMR